LNACFLQGAVIARLVIGDSSLCFVNCHLAAGQNALKQRNADIAAILEEKAIFESSHLEAAYVGGGDGTMVMDHEFVFVRYLTFISFDSADALSGQRRSQLPY